MMPTKVKFQTWIIAEESHHPQISHNYKFTTKIIHAPPFSIDKNISIHVFKE